MEESVKRLEDGMESLAKELRDSLAESQGRCRWRGT